MTLAYAKWTERNVGMNRHLATGSPHRAYAPNLWVPPEPIENTNWYGSDGESSMFETRQILRTNLYKSESEASATASTPTSISDE